MLKLGEKIISDIYLGDKKIAKVFWGDKLVYQSSKPIFLDYIITDGKSYIDTEFNPNSLTTKLEIDFVLLDDTTVTQAVFGCRERTQADGKSCNIFYNVNSNKSIRIDWSGSITAVTVNTNELISMSCLGNAVTINGTTYTGTTAKVDTYLSMPILLGNMYNATNIFGTGSKIQIHKCKIYDNGVLVRDLRPCIALNGQVAMYDEVNKKYHYNAGTGELKAGGRFVKSILFDGASYIDTGIKHQTCTVECDLRFEETGTRQLMGFATSTGQYWGKGANSSTIEYFSGTNVLDRTLVTLEYNTDDITAPTMIKYADGKTSAITTGTRVAEFTYTIGAVGTTKKSYYCTIEVWGQKTYINGELIQDLRPYVDENNVACFKDVVTGNLFYNKGTGTLGYTEE